jgi:hypothetical protein
LNWKGAGGSVAIFGADAFGNLGQPPLHEVHTAAVLDMDFSPFNPNILATAS